MRGRLRPPHGSAGSARFQSTPPCGGDKDQLGYLVNIVKFQSTPPCGGDKVNNVSHATAATFQSTPPCGGDNSQRCCLWIQSISIHAPMRGRRGKPRRNHHTPDFNPRPHAGATNVIFDGVPVLLFQSTPPCGGDCKMILHCG